MKEAAQEEWRVQFHKALSNPVRLQIVETLIDGELCQCDIFPSIGLSQSTVSAYLTQLVQAGILHVRRDGQRKLYSIANDKILNLISQTKKVAAALS
ncbi:MAG: metalloregulator ArsR/SmtB family transcription factor [Candidatus Lokiarchaeota archaeon]|nr:metalloregulator ArsR/SmtB family transcription factor [Candidatus Lokiarchaeota archaeon]